MKLVQNLVAAHPEITRMDTTLSADGMTLEPLFTFNPNSPEVSNLHTAAEWEGEGDRYSTRVQRSSSSLLA